MISMSQYMYSPLIISKWLNCFYIVFSNVLQDDILNTNPSPAFTLSARPATPTVSSQRCLCHVHLEETANYKLFTEKTWETFRQKANIRMDTIAQEMTDIWDGGHKHGYHMKCYQRYINTSRNLPGPVKIATIKTPPQKEIEIQSPVKKKLRNQATPVKGSDKNKCAICKSSKRKWVKGPGGRRIGEYPKLCSSFAANDALLDAAKKTNKFLMQAELTKTPDAVAGDVMYHRSCYRNFVYGHSHGYQHHEQKRETLSDTAKVKEIHSVAFDKLCIELQKDLHDTKNVRRMADIKARYIELLSQEGIDAPNYRTNKLKKKLVKHLGANISFSAPADKSLSETVFSGAVSKGQIVEAAIQQTAESIENIDLNVESGESNNLFHTAKAMRLDLKSMDSPVPDIPTAKDLTEENIVIPDSLYNFLAWTVTDNEDVEVRDGGKVKLSDKHHRIVSSMAQDMIYAAHSGKFLTPKHVNLAHTVKNLTGSVEIVTLLNRFNHCISDSRLHRHENDLWNKQCEQHGNNVRAPTNIFPGIYVTAVWDNIDLNQETLDGSGTTHHTNGILLQQNTVGCSPSTDMIETQRRALNFDPLPNVIIPYYSKERKGPPQPYQRPPNLNEYKCKDSQLVLKLDFLWFLLRLPLSEGSLFDFNSQQTQIIPGWSPFNHILRKEAIPMKNTIGYCQVIDDSPTKLSTVYTALKRSIAMAHELAQEEIDIVFDQAIYCKALEVIWSQGDEFSKCVPRLGPFHTACVFMNVIGKRFQDAGLSDILIECNIVAANSVPGVLSGHHYNRAVRAHKIVYEAFMRLKWSEFGRWLNRNSQPVNVMLLYDGITNVKDNLTAKEADSFIDSPEFNDLFELYKDFCKQSKSPQSEYWSSYNDMVEVLLTFIRSTRIGEVDMNVQCINDIRKWVHAYDCNNYARYLPVHYLIMRNLEDTHPTVHDQLKNKGQFGVQRSNASGFSKVAEDMAIEQSINKDTKAPGGIVKFSLKQQAVQRWIGNAPERAAMTDNCRKMAGIKEEVDGHKEMSGNRISTDESAVMCIVDYIENGNMNPFACESDEITSLTSGIVAPEDVKLDLLKAKQIGERNSNEFIEKRLLTNEVPFHEPISGLGLKTFSDLVGKQKSQTSSQKEVIIKADRSVFARLLVVAQQRENITIDEVLRYELGPLPWSMATVFGTMQKTTKSLMTKVLITDEHKVKQIPPNSACIIDMMALVQSWTKIPDSFGMLANDLLQHITSIPAKRIDIVCDTYPLISVKNPEREERASAGTLVMKIRGPDQKCADQFKKFLRHGENKESLIEFLYSEWQKPQYASMIGDHKIFLTHKDECHMITQVRGKIRVILKPHLCSSQEEADTRMFLHADDAANSNINSIWIKTIDTDVVALACFYQPLIRAKLYIERKAGNKNEIIDVSALVKTLGVNVCKALPPYHALTGCDSVSALSGRGKKDGLELLKTDNKLCKLLSNVGDSLELDKKDKQNVEKFVCRLYGYEAQNVNDVRIAMFKEGVGKGKSVPDSNKLPPTSDALAKHILRVNYQAYIWKHALIATQEKPPTPDRHGWLITDNKLKIDWTDKECAPSAILELMSCGCKGNCSNNRCGCKKSTLVCTEACNCPEECTNTRPSSEENEESENEESENEESENEESENEESENEESENGDSDGYSSDHSDNSSTSTRPTNSTNDSDSSETDDDLTLYAMA